MNRCGTLEELRERHSHSLRRIAHDGRNPVPPLTAFEVVGYRRDTDLASRPFAAFELRTPDFDRFQPYDTARRAGQVAGMVRNPVATLAAQIRPFGWTDEDINTFVHGHTRDGTDRATGDDAGRRFSYLPLPSLERRPSGIHVSAIRRVLIAAPPERRDAVLWSRVLSGQELSPIGDTRPSALRLIEGTEASLRRNPNLGPYVDESRVWSTVTPVVLPGYDDPNHLRRKLRENRDAATQKRLLAQLDSRIEGLLRKALRQAGVAEELVNGAVPEWRAGGFRAGVGLANSYARPEKVTAFSAYHVRVRFAHPVRGPLAIGAGRYRGLGVLAGE